MKGFEFILPSNDSAEDLWAALNTPIRDGDLNRSVNTGLYVIYEDLDDEGLVRTGSHLMAVVDKSKMSLLPKKLTDRVPSSLSIKVEEVSADKKRIDIFEPEQIVEGALRRQVRESENNTSLLVVEGELAVQGLSDLWPSFLGDLNDTAIYYGVRRPNEEIVNNISKILGR